MICLRFDQGTELRLLYESIRAVDRTISRKIVHIGKGGSWHVHYRQQRKVLLQEPANALERGGIVPSTESSFIIWITE